MSPRIALIHPEGNFPNNPHLSSLLDLLLERGHAVDVFCPPNASHSQAKSHPRLTLHSVPPPGGAWDPLRGALFGPLASPRSVGWLARRHLPKFALFLGVDLGVAEAAKMARAQGAAHGLLSYELLFAAEVGADFKRPEIDACRDLAFALCQDDERAGQLAAENRFDQAHIINAPVAGRGARPGPRTFRLHDALGLPRSTKLALVLGSAEAAWTGAAQLLADVALWPGDWALVLHHRYQAGDLDRLLAGADPHVRGKVHVSPFPSLPDEDLHLLLHACDLGLCLYTPTYDHPLLGRNLRHIGMASGKFTTCLRHGLPVVVNSQGEMARHVLEQSLGWRVDGIGEIHRLLASLDRREIEARRGPCLDFFTRRCDAATTAPPLLAAIEEACSRPSGRAAFAGGADGRDEAPPDCDALCALARLHLADGRPEQAASALLAALRSAGTAAEVEAAYGVALALHRGGSLQQALAVYQGVFEHAGATDALAAWALFKSGELRREQGGEGEALRFFAQALARNPAHAKAAIFCAPPTAPLRVRLAAEPKPSGSGANHGGSGHDSGQALTPGRVAVNMNPLDAELWEYYFSRRGPDEADLHLAAPLTPEAAQRLAGLLALYLAPGGTALLRQPAGAGKSMDAGRLTPLFEQAGLRAQVQATEPGEAAVTFRLLRPSAPSQT
ncbi:hypothetical protein [Humidesulfovibrio idahonensis]